MAPHQKSAYERRLTAAAHKFKDATQVLLAEIQEHLESGHPEEALRMVREARNVQ